MNNKLLEVICDILLNRILTFKKLNLIVDVNILCKYLLNEKDIEQKAYLILHEFSSVDYDEKQLTYIISILTRNNIILIHKLKDIIKHKLLYLLMDLNVIEYNSTSLPNNIIKQIDQDDNTIGLLKVYLSEDKYTIISYCFNNYIFLNNFRKE